jgi:hypothetical protein
MKSSILLVATAVCAASAAEARVGPSPRLDDPVVVPMPRVPGPARGFALSSQPTNCAITVAFGSFGPGIDGATLGRMERQLRTDRRVRTYSRHPWGREGEVTLCIYVRSSRGGAELSRQLREMVPARARGPVTIQFFPSRVR